MEILPAIDLLGGRAVRLKQGRYDDATVYDDDPPGVARRWKGVVRRLHVVDLEGARAGHAVQREIVRAIVEAFGPGVQVGGGVRSTGAAESYLELGVERVVLGTAAAERPDVVREIAERNPGRVVVALDARDGVVATSGWETMSARTATELATDLVGIPIAAVLYTDIARDGMQVGPNIAATAALARIGLPVLASGGVGSLAHLRALAAVPGVVGAIVGRALYEGAFTLEEAVQAAGEAIV